MKNKNNIFWGDIHNHCGISYGHGKMKIKNGEIISVEPCFRGRSILYPKDDSIPKRHLPHEIKNVDKYNCEWISNSTKNPTNFHSATQSLILKLNAGTRCTIKINLNGVKKEIPLEFLLKGSQSFYTEKYFSEAVLIHKAVSEDSYSFKFRFFDEKPEHDIDYYYLKIAQKNNQCAWISPIWVIS